MLEVNRCFNGFVWVKPKSNNLDFQNSGQSTYLRNLGFYGGNLTDHYFLVTYTIFSMQ